MAFDTNFGSGALGDIVISDGAIQNLNSYARIVAANSNTITIDAENMYLGNYEKFRAGEEILIHVSATNRTTADELGKYMFATITLVNGDILTLDRDIFTINFDYEYAQIISVANFDCLTLNKDAVITPQPYNPFKFHGGIVALKCWDSLIFNGGNIDLTDAGIPAGRKNFLRPLLNQETAAQGETDGAKFAGWENFSTADRLILNAGDGACFIAAKKLICHEDSRIGNPKTHGAQFCRGAKDSVGVKPSNITNIGGSTILIAAETIENFTPKIIAKYRSSDLMEGKGLCRCYIASQTKLRADEGLYSYDCISDLNRLQNVIGVKDFGDGSFGDLTNPNFPLNNYAHIVSIERGGCLVRIDGETLRGLAPIDTGALVLIQVIQKADKHIADAGKIAVAKVISRVENELALDFPAPIVNLSNYLAQVISIPQFENFTLNENFTATMKFDGEIGGVCALAVNGNCNISGGKVNVMSKGGAAAYGRAGLSVIGNAQDSDKLPLGSGHGSVFILARNLICNENSRIGAVYSGAGEGNRLGGNNSDGTNQGGGYSGQPDQNFTGSGAGYIGAGRGARVGARGGSPATANGGNNRNGSHILIVAENLDGLSIANISSGGAGGEGAPNAQNGAAGYGGGGGLTDGGDSGFCFVYSGA